MRLIDADALIPMMKYATTDSEIGIFPIKIGFDAIVKVIDEQPTIEPDLDEAYAHGETEAEARFHQRQKGQWIKHVDDLFPAESTIECSMCHHEQPITIDDSFCPNCGTDMRTEEKPNDT